MQVKCLSRPKDANGKAVLAEEEKRISCLVLFDYKLANQNRFHHLIAIYVIFSM